MIVSKIRLLFFAGVAAIPIALTSCADPEATGEYNTTVVEPTPDVSAVVVVPGQAIEPAININDASDRELIQLADKIGVPDLPEKIKQNRPYNDINELVSKEVISPQQLDYIQNDILVKDVSETTQEGATNQ